jgi:prolyl 4-hydroxylase
MEEPDCPSVPDASGLDAHHLALGRAVQRFFSLEWAVISVAETVAPGIAAESRHLTSRELGARFEQIVQQVGTGAVGADNLAALANRYGELVQERDRLLHGHPNSSGGEPPQLLFTATTGRKVWTVAEMEALALQFAEAAADAMAILGGWQAGQPSVATAPAVSDPHSPYLPGSEPAVLAGFSESVRVRLDANPAAFRMPAENIELYVMRGFLSADECAKLIELIETDLKPSTILAAQLDRGFRTSHSCNLPPTHPLVLHIDRRIADTVGVPPSHSETVQGQRYVVGQEFKPHNDYFHSGQYYTQGIAEEGGQRTWTAMAFLNEPEAGGATNFPEARIKIAPKAGNLVIWNNLDALGLPNPATLHQGMPVEGGMKYVITKWFREREWGRAPASTGLGR